MWDQNAKYIRFLAELRCSHFYYAIIIYILTSKNLMGLLCNVWVFYYIISTMKYMSCQNNVAKIKNKNNCGISDINCEVIPMKCIL